MDGLDGDRESVLARLTPEGRFGYVVAEAIEDALRGAFETHRLSDKRVSAAVEDRQAVIDGLRRNAPAVQRWADDTIQRLQFRQSLLPPPAQCKSIERERHQRLCQEVIDSLSTTKDRVNHVVSLLIADETGRPVNEFWKRAVAANLRKLIIVLLDIACGDVSPVLGRLQLSAALRRVAANMAKLGRWVTGQLGDQLVMPEEVRGDRNQTVKRWEFEAGLFRYEGKTYDLPAVPLAMLKIFIERPTQESFTKDDLRPALRDELANDETVRQHLVVLRKKLRIVASDFGFSNAGEFDPIPHKNSGWRFTLPRGKR